MADYQCPVCGHPDPTAYYRCSRADCPDGRDWRARGEAPPSKRRVGDVEVDTRPNKELSPKTASVLLVIFYFFMITSFALGAIVGHVFR